MNVIDEVLAERRAQDAKYGPNHDDRHYSYEWGRFIEAQLRKGGKTYRERMIAVAAVAIAAVESLDRLEARALLTPEVPPKPVVGVTNE